jgi:hypothetical protein
MKSWRWKGILAVATFVLVVTVALLSVPSGFAGIDDDKVECDLNTLKGQYLFSVTGMVFPPAFGVTEPSAAAVAGYSTYNGDGTGEDHVSFTINGIDQNIPSPEPFTYTINPDCTGTRILNPATAPPNGPHFDMFVASNGEGLTELAINPGVSLTSFTKRVSR